MPNCKHCSTSFSLSPQEEALLKKVAPSIAGNVVLLPKPTLCADCRMRRRLIWRNELNLFRGQDCLTGKQLLTFVPPIAGAQVVSVENWHGDSWDELAYGRDFDFQRPFFEQFAELVRSVPLIALANIRCENSDYANCAAECKNCYLLGGANVCENCLYGNYINRSKNCIDCNFLNGCELCYECIDCKDCYHVAYSQNCSGCSDSKFLFQCRNVSDCFGCVNLAHKRFCVFNEQLSEADYRAYIERNALTTRAAVSRTLEAFDEFRLKYPHRAFQGDRLEAVVGSSINNARNCLNCFDATDLDCCANAAWLHSARDCMDIFSWGMSAELCYECLEVGDDSYRTLFSSTTWSSSEILYCYLTKSSKNCFGSVGLRKKDYCILNKQYEKQAYEDLLTKIVEHMQRTGEWGEFFPMSVSPHAYNTSICNDYYPLTREQAEELGAKWYEPAEPNTLHVGLAPDVVPKEDSDYVNAVYRCQTSGKPYRLVAPEIAFYRSEHIPLPTHAFLERHRRRLARRAPRKVWTRKCTKCRSDVASVYSPERRELIYCAECFSEELS